MSLFGLSLVNVLLVGAGASAAAVAMYLLRPRQRVFLVPFAPLWQGVLAGEQPRALFRRLRGLLGLLLVLTILWLLSWALGRPAMGLGEERPRAIVVGVDVSASMAARTGGVRRIDEAKAAAHRVIESTSAPSVALVAFDDAVQVLSPFTSNRRDIHRRIDALATSSCAGRTLEALERIDALAQARDAAVVLIGDADAAEELGDTKPSADLRLVEVGSHAENVGILTFAMRGELAGSDDYQTMLRVGNFGLRNRAFTVKILRLEEDRETLVDAVSMELGPGQEKTAFFPSFGDISGRVIARLYDDEGNVLSDDLDADNEAYIYAAARSRVRVLVVTRGNLFLESALGSDDGVILSTVTPEDFAGAGESDVIIFDGDAPDAAPGAATIAFPRDEELASLPEDQIVRPGPIEARRDHPIFSSVSLRDVRVRRARRLSPQAGQTVLAESVAGEPLIVEGGTSGAPQYVLAFDPCASEWPIRAAFPLFWANIVRAASGRWLSVPFASVKSASSCKLKGLAGVERFRFTAPDGSVQTLSGKGDVQVSCRQVGFFRVESEDGTSYVGSNLFDADESDLNGEDGPGDRIVPRSANGVPSTGMLNLWRPLTVIAMGIVLLEWYTFTRRLTV